MLEGPINLGAAYGGMQSSMRNMFLLSSIGLALIGLSHKFSKVAIPVTASIVSFCVAIWVGLQGMADFEAARLNKSNHTQTWNRWKFVTYTYVTFIVFIIGWTVKRTFMNNSVM